MVKIILLFGLLLSFNDTQAQGWIDQRANTMRQRNQQRIIPRRNNQSAYQNNQRNGRSERQYQQRRENQQHNDYAERVEPANSVNPSDINNHLQGNDKVVTLVVNGTGQTKEEATRNALRSAIEQAFGTFVSANTEVLNDELIKDEIATVTSGNVHQFNVLSTTKDVNGLYDVSIQAVVSIGNLTNYARSKGFQVELAGAEFVMNMKMRELNKKNELAAIEHLTKKLKSIASNGGLFNYELERSEPILVSDSRYGVKLKLLLCGNANTKAFYDEIYNTIGALSLSKQEVEEYKKIGLNYYVYDKQLIYTSKGEYALRNYYPNLYEWIGNDVETEISWLMPTLIEQALQFVIYDNLGNQFYCTTDTKYKSEGCIWHYSNTEDCIGRGDGNEVYYYLEPQNHISLVKGNLFRRRKPTGFGYATQEIIIGIPLHNYELTSLIPHSSQRSFNGESRIHFNPMEEVYEYECTDSRRREMRMERIRKKCFYQLEFFALYSEEELYKLENIAVKNRTGNAIVEIPVSNLENVLQNSEVQNTKEIDNLTNQTDALFPGGSSAMFQYISKNTMYPPIAAENGIQGDVIVQFDVEKDGSLSNIKIAKSLDSSLDKEALRVVRNMPKWTPATKVGVAVSSHQTISIPFRLK